MVDSEDIRDIGGAVVLLALAESKNLRKFGLKCTDEKVREFFQAVSGVLYWTRTSSDLAKPLVPSTLAGIGDSAVARGALSSVADLEIKLVERLSVRLSAASSRKLKAAIQLAGEAKQAISDEIDEPTFARMLALQDILDGAMAEPMLKAQERYQGDHRAILTSLAAEADRVLGYRPIELLREIYNSPKIKVLMRSPRLAEVDRDYIKSIFRRATADGILSKRERS